MPSNFQHHPPPLMSEQLLTHLIKRDGGGGETAPHQNQLQNVMPGMNLSAIGGPIMTTGPSAQGHQGFQSIPTPEALLMQKMTYQGHVMPSQPVQPYQQVQQQGASFVLPFPMDNGTMASVSSQSMSSSGVNPGAVPYPPAPGVMQGAPGMLVGQTSNNRRHYVWACDVCYKRKRKCDAAQPVCSNCVKLKTPCTYNRRHDPSLVNRPASKKNAASAAPSTTAPPPVEVSGAAQTYAPYLQQGPNAQAPNMPTPSTPYHGVGTMGMTAAPMFPSSHPFATNSNIPGAFSMQPPLVPSSTYTTTPPLGLSVADGPPKSSLGSPDELQTFLNASDEANYLFFENRLQKIEQTVRPLLVFSRTGQEAGLDDPGRFKKRLKTGEAGEMSVGGLGEGAEMMSLWNQFMGGFGNPGGQRGGGSVTAAASIDSQQSQQGSMFMQPQQPLFAIPSTSTSQGNPAPSNIPIPLPSHQSETVSTTNPSSSASLEKPSSQPSSTAQSGQPSAASKPFLHTTSNNNIISNLPPIASLSLSSITSSISIAASPSLSSLAPNAVHPSTSSSSSTNAISAYDLDPSDHEPDPSTTGLPPDFQINQIRDFTDLPDSYITVILEMFFRYSTRFPMSFISRYKFALALSESSSSSSSSSSSTQGVQPMDASGVRRFETKIKGIKPLLLNAIGALTCLNGKGLDEWHLKGMEWEGLWWHRRVALRAFFFRAQSILESLVDDEGQWIQEEGNESGPDVQDVQALMILAVFCQLTGETSMSWMYGGMASRTAELIKLNVDPDQLIAEGILPPLSWLEKETRRRTWWCLYTMDQFDAGFLGRSSGISRNPCRVNLPSSDFFWYSNPPGPRVLTADSADTVPPSVSGKETPQQQQQQQQQEKAHVEASVVVSQPALATDSDILEKLHDHNDLSASWISLASMFRRLGDVVNAFKERQQQQQLQQSPTTGSSASSGSSARIAAETMKEIGMLGTTSSGGGATSSFAFVSEGRSLDAEFALLDSDLIDWMEGLPPAARSVLPSDEGVADNEDEDDIKDPTSTTTTTTTTSTTTSTISTYKNSASSADNQPDSQTNPSPSSSDYVNMFSAKLPFLYISTSTVTSLLSRGRFSNDPQSVNPPHFVLGGWHLLHATCRLLLHRVRLIDRLRSAQGGGGGGGVGVVGSGVVFAKGAVGSRVRNKSWLADSSMKVCREMADRITEVLAVHYVPVLAGGGGGSGTTADAGGNTARDAGSITTKDAGGGGVMGRMDSDLRKDLEVQEEDEEGHGGGGVETKGVGLQQLEDEEPLDALIHVASANEAYAILEGALMHSMIASIAMTEGKSKVVGQSLDKVKIHRGALKILGKRLEVVRKMDECVGTFVDSLVASRKDRGGGGGGISSSSSRGSSKHSSPGVSSPSD
ncbi:hypothetical protein HDV05_006804 [Chytridiales sp. JEL 0842]|nr:hypothetical protein HDV05_006804 [Chytridiales sp. JEL 0842]